MEDRWCLAPGGDEDGVCEPELTALVVCLCWQDCSDAVYALKRVPGFAAVTVAAGTDVVCVARQCTCGGTVTGWHTRPQCRACQNHGTTSAVVGLCVGFDNKSTSKYVGQGVCGDS